MTGCVGDSCVGPYPAAMWGCWLAALAFRSCLVEGTGHGHEEVRRPGDCSARRGDHALVLVPVADVVEPLAPLRRKSPTSWSCSHPTVAVMPLK
jgi:hypothetical protein